MRLLNVHTFTLEAFYASGAAPAYAILSHTWGDEEVEYQDLQDLDAAQKKAGFDKIRHTCDQAKEHGLHYAWVDTCCASRVCASTMGDDTC